MARPGGSAGHGAALVVMVVVVVIVVVVGGGGCGGGGGGGCGVWFITKCKSTCGNYDSDLQLSSHLCSQQLVNIPRVLIVHV